MTDCIRCRGKGFVTVPYHGVEAIEKPCYFCDPELAEAELRQSTLSHPANKVAPCE